MISLFNSEHSLKSYLNKRRRRLGPRDEANLLRQLGLLLNSGTQLADGLEVLGDSLDGPSQSFCRRLEKSIRSGTPISVAISREKDCLSAVTPSLVSAGEATGSLVATVGLAADWAEHDSGLLDQVKAALVYPCFVLGTNLVLAACLLVFILPAFQPLFGDEGLPLLTQFILSISDVLRSPFFWIIALFVGVEAFMFGTRPEGRDKYYRALLMIPAVGSLLRTAAGARFLSIVSITAKVGLRITKGLALAARASGDPDFVGLDKGLQVHLRDGGELPDYFSTHQDIYGSLLYQIMSLCAETGKFESVCKRFADYYRGETEYYSAQVKNLLEPILMIFVAISTATILLSAYLPLAGVLQKLLN